MTTRQSVWEGVYSVDMLGADWTGLASPHFLCRIMQEAAIQNAELIGFGTAQMLQDGIVWILSRQQIRIDELPAWKEQVTVRTWYADREKLLFHRDFEILDRDEKVIVRAATAWLGLDVARRRPVRTDRINHNEPADRPRAVDEPWCAVPEMADPAEGRPFHVFARDLDMSNHANNVNYPEWLLEPLDIGFRSAHDLISLDVAYQAEAVHGDELLPLLVPESVEGFLHRIVRPSDGKTICSGRSAWRRRETPRASGWKMSPAGADREPMS